MLYSTFRAMKAKDRGCFGERCGATGEPGVIRERVWWASGMAEWLSGGQGSQLLERSLRAHPARLTAEAIAHGSLAAHQTSPQPCAMRDAVIIPLDLDPNASAPYGVTPVQPLHGSLEG